eukprot:GHVR01081691.1.p1 GENE.GHVR01081691.1~~GHVR01081691.1.p1  ORF type:complete len:114 (-),score=21.14 GHVR01081691.1:928-1269(-)
MSRPPYGKFDFPTTPGSGAGFFMKDSKGVSSSGGGVINIQVDEFYATNSIINSDGKEGTQGGGGGAGGSVSIDYLTIMSSMSISANGGNGTSSGAGGRIRLWNHNWKFEISEV